MKLSDRHSAPSQSRPTTSVWRSPILWFTIALFTTLLALPLIHPTPRVISALYVDVSASNQPFRAEVVGICEERLTHLQPRDVFITVQFADQPVLQRDGTYEEQQQDLLQADCKQVLQPISTVGKQPGTSFSRAFENLRSHLQHQRSQHNRDRVVAIFLLQAAEIALGQPNLNWKLIKQQVKDLVTDGSVVLIMGSEATLQQQLITLLKDLANTKVCTYSDSKDSLKWAFNLARTA